MKTKIFSIILIIAFFVAGPGCKKFDLDPNDLTLSANLSIFKTIVNFTYMDATTGLPLSIPANTKMKIEVTAPVNDLIVNTSSGEFQSTYYANFAISSFGLNPYSLVPTLEKPVKLLVKASLANYLESYVTVVLSEERNYNQEVRLMSVENPPEGVTIEQHDSVGTTSSSGETKEIIEIKTQDSTVSVTMEAGTILKDESGQTLSGNISVEMISIDVSTTEGIQNVPALSQPIITEDGKVSALFSPIAYSRVEITDDAGHKAATVTGKDMIIITNLNPTIINPKTRKPLAVGDLVPSYYFDRKDGSWKFFGRDTVSEENNQIRLVKVIKSKKSTGDENFSEITYSFDEETPMDIQVLINLPDTKPSLPTTFNIVIKGIDDAGGTTDLFSNDVTVFTRRTVFTVNNISMGYVSYSVKLTGAELKDGNGITHQKTLAELEAELKQITFLLTESQFKDPVSGDGPTRLYLQFSCVPTSGNPLFMDSPYLPNSFYLIFSGTNFTGETILQIQGGSFIVPFNPMLQTGGTWHAKVVMGDMEYPKGQEMVTVTNNDFYTVDGKVFFLYTPETAEGCDDFKKALGLN
jgi:hypothetical protein